MPRDQQERGCQLNLPLTLLSPVQKYLEINKEGFRKILKKHDKVGLYGCGIGGEWWGAGGYGRGAQGVEVRHAVEGGSRGLKTLVRRDRMGV